MVTTVVFTACNSDDDFGGDLNSDITGQYSLATRMMTQRMEGGDEDKYGPRIAEGSDSTKVGDFTVHVSWNEGYTTGPSPVSKPSASATTNDTTITIIKVTADWIGLSGINGDILYSKKGKTGNTHYYITVNFTYL